jgi:hypothetical protein
MKARIPLLMVAVLVGTAAQASESMRCGSRLVSDGDPKAKVADVCGQPTHTERRTVLRSGIARQNLDDNNARTRTITESELLIHNRSLVEVEVEVWLYNRGRSSLLRELVFHDNRLIAVNILGRGYCAVWARHDNGPLIRTILKFSDPKLDPGGDQTSTSIRGGTIPRNRRRCGARAQGSAAAPRALRAAAGRRHSA